MPLITKLEVELFDICGIDFMRPFPTSYENHYMLIVVDYVSKWVETFTSPTNDAQVIVKFLKKFIFTRFGTLRVIIRDRGLHFCKHLFERVLKEY